MFWVLRHKKKGAGKEENGKKQIIPERKGKGKIIVCNVKSLDLIIMMTLGEKMLWNQNKLWCCVYWYWVHCITVIFTVCKLRN